MVQTIGVFLTLVLLLTACANVDELKKPTQVEQYGDLDTAHDINRLRAPNEHFMTNLAFDRALSDTVTAIDGVNTGWVVTANKRAYVAIILETSEYRRGKPMERGGVVERNPAMMKPYQGLVATPGNTHRALGDVANGLKLEISRRIGAADRSIEEVYVLSNRAFVNRLNQYAMIAVQGKSLQPYVNEFELLVQKWIQASPQEVTLSGPAGSGSPGNERKSSEIR